MFQRSGNGREKEVDVAMGHQITKTLYRDLANAKKENVIFITATGDRDLRPPIQDALGNGVSVELWSWKHCMAQDYRQAKTEKIFTVNCLEKENFSYTAYMSTREKTNIDQAHAIVYEGVPKGEDSLKMVSAHMTRLLRLFYITKIEKEETQDLIVEFPKTKREVVLKQLLRLGTFDYEPCSYEDYEVSQQQRYQIQSADRFAALGEIEMDDESFLDVVESCLSLDMEDIPSDDESIQESEESTTDSTDTDEEDAAFTYNNWHREVCKKARKIPERK